MILNFAVINVSVRRTLTIFCFTSNMGGGRGERGVIITIIYDLRAYMVPLKQHEKIENFSLISDVKFSYYLVFFNVLRQNIPVSFRFKLDFTAIDFSLLVTSNSQISSRNLSLKTSIERFSISTSSLSRLVHTKKIMHGDHFRKILK